MIIEIRRVVSWGGMEEEGMANGLKSIYFAVCELYIKKSLKSNEEDNTFKN